MSVLSIICQAAKHTIFPLDYLYLLGKGCTRTLLFHFCSVRRVLLHIAERRRLNEPRHPQNSEDTQPRLTLVSKHPYTCPDHPANATDQYISTALTRKKADQVVVELQS